MIWVILIQLTYSQTKDHNFHGAEENSKTMGNVDLGVEVVFDYWLPFYSYTLPMLFPQPITGGNYLYVSYNRSNKCHRLS